MSFKKLQFRPGINREGTNLSNEGGWFDGDKIRFRSGFPEKIGGWAAASTNYFVGTCRSLWNWVTLKGANLLGVGTHLRFYVEEGGTYYDITPLRAAANTGVITSIKTVEGSRVVTILDPTAASIALNDSVVFSGQTTPIGGVVINGTYLITGLVSGGYTINAVMAATAAANSTSNPNITSAYLIPAGSDVYSFNTGWGTGPWGINTPSIDLNNPFSTTSGSSTVTVAYGNHGLTTGDWVYFTAIADATVGGLNTNLALKNRSFRITVVNANSFTVSTVFGSQTFTASSTVANVGGAVVMLRPPVVKRGWGDGFASGIGSQLRLWSQTNFGEQLLFCPRGGSLYSWSPGPAVTPNYNVRGQLVTGTQVPAAITQIMVSASSRITIAFGCTDFAPPIGTGNFDPMLIRWTAQESYTDWLPSATNQAGSYRLSHGSQILSAMQSRQEIVVWTDAATYSMQYVGYPAVYGVTLLADNTSIISPNCAATASGVMFWMGIDKFYVYSGRVETLPCAVKAYVYEDINLQQSFQFFAGTNEGYNEVWWFYCSADSSVIDRYVIYNYLDKIWYYGTLTRTAWLDSPLRSYPIAASGSSNIVYHESAVDDEEASNPRPLNAYVESSIFDIEDGDRFTFIDRIMPDVTFDGSSGTSFPYVNMVLKSKQTPGGPPKSGAVTTTRSTQSYANTHQHKVQEFTEMVYVRMRGRQMAFRIESNTLGTQWQLGAPRVYSRTDGRR